MDVVVCGGRWGRRQQGGTWPAPESPPAELHPDGRVDAPPPLPPIGLILTGRVPPLRDRPHCPRQVLRPQQRRQRAEVGGAGTPAPVRGGGLGWGGGGVAVVKLGHYAKARNFVGGMMALARCGRGGALPTGCNDNGDDNSLPSLLVDYCRFHCHRRVAIHPPLLPLPSLCRACHHHPSPPLLVDCCIFHVHCCCAVHRHRRRADHCYCRHPADHCCQRRHSVAPSIAVAVASPLRCPSPLRRCHIFHRRCCCVAVVLSLSIAAVAS